MGVGLVVGRGARDDAGKKRFALVHLRHGGRERMDAATYRQDGGYEGRKLRVRASSSD